VSDLDAAARGPAVGRLLRGGDRDPAAQLEVVVRDDLLGLVGPGRFDLAEDPTEDASELDLYYTRHLTEFRRLRFGVTLGDGVEADTRAYIQFTNYFGSHAHGLNW